MAQIKQIGPEIFGLSNDGLVFPRHFALLTNAQATQQAQQTGFANAVVALQMQPLPRHQAEGDIRKKSAVAPTE